MKTLKDISLLKDLPLLPGVYLFKDISGKIIYVGKAKSLRNRVSSYFHNDISLGIKTQALVGRVKEIDYIETLSELEALILEAELIKKHRPKYNIALKDDKSYLYIVFRNELLKVDDKKVLIPKVITARKSDLLPKDEVFGPYPNSNTARYIVKILRKIFPYRDCSASKFSRHQKLKRPCLYGHIGLCQAPCTDAISVDDYKKDLVRIKKLLRGNRSTLVREFEKQMTQASKNMEYESAAYYRDILKKLDYVRANYKSAEKYIENPNLTEDLADQSLLSLKSNIPFLTNLPSKIECYDISNISGKEAVGSMVVATNGAIDKSQYKRFKIKLESEPNDFAMMCEVLERRLTNGLENKAGWTMPDLIVLDGGKGQLSVVRELMQRLNVVIPTIGLAKKKETIVMFAGDTFEELNLSLDDEGLKLLIRLRDEAHRFAQRYHHHLRLKKLRV